MPGNLLPGIFLFVFIKDSNEEKVEKPGFFVEESSELCERWKPWVSKSEAVRLSGTPTII
jgi:hypothetical protein